MLVFIVSAAYIHHFAVLVQFVKLNHLDEILECVEWLWRESFGQAVCCVLRRRDIDEFESISLNLLLLPVEFDVHMPCPGINCRISRELQDSVIIS
jgi:hypothetical protein